MMSEDRKIKLSKVLELCEKSRNLWSESYRALIANEISRDESEERAKSASALCQRAEMLLCEIELEGRK